MQKNMVNYADYSIQEIGSYLIHQNDILDSVDVLQSILDDTQGQLDQTFFSRLYLYFNSIRDRVISDWDRSRGYIILEGPDSIALHLYTIWPVVNNKKECIDHLQYEIKRIYEDYRKPSGDISYGLTFDEIEELMQHVQDKFLYSTILLSDTPLMICFIKCIHAKSNALYSYTRKVGGSIEDLLLLPYKNQMSCFPQKFIYLHELGHLLHFRTTHNIRQLPATFYTLLEHWKTSRPMLNVEVFAEFFAIAALYDPSLENDTIPYQLEAEAKNIILAYYILLFCQIKNGDYIESANTIDRLFRNRKSDDPVKTDPKMKRASAFRKKLNKQYKNMPDAVDVSQACEILGIGKKKLYTLIASQKLVSVKVGSKFLLPKVCVLDYMEQCSRG